MFITTSVALACGGLFCNTAVPVSQVEEAVVFAVDPVEQTTTMHVQIGYAGPAEDFAWVLPIPGNPEVVPSTVELFLALQQDTRPTWRIEERLVDCPLWQMQGSESDSDTDTDTDTDADSDADTDGAGVTLVSTGRVGAYETAVLTAVDADALESWLQANDYDVPTGTGDALAPYLGGDTHFLALKLASTGPVGDLEPLAIAFPGVTPSIPMRLTALAVEPDMPLTVYVMGPSRALPSNYLHMQLNPLRADWWSPRPWQHIQRAADEAGGRAFMTAYSGELPTQLVVPSAQQLANLRSRTSLESWLPSLRQNGFPALTLDELLAVLPLPDSTDPQSFYNCPVCFPDTLQAMEFDAVAVTDLLDDQLMEPRRRANALLAEAEVVTRLQTTLSASEMTIDPIFQFVQGLPPVAAQRVLTLERQCGDRDLDDVPYTITAGELQFTGPSDDDLRAKDMTLSTWFASLSTRDTLQIDALEDGELLRLADNRASIERALDESGERMITGGSRWGCQIGPTTTWGLMFLLPLVVSRRR